MASITWNGASGDWTNAANWAGGTAPGAGDVANFTGAGAYTATLYATASVAGITMNAPGALLYDAGLIALGGLFNLQAGTFALAYGTLQGGTLALSGGTLQASGGTLDAVAVQGTLSMTQANASLFVKDGLAMAGAGGSGTGTLAVTGSYAALDFLGTQTLANAVVTLGSIGTAGAASIGVSHAYGATSGATLNLAATDWVQETGIKGQIIIGAGLPSGLTDTVINRGTITNATANGTLTIGGTGTFINTGTIGISNGATLDIAAAGFSGIM